MALPATLSRPCAAGAIGWRRRAKPCRAPGGGGARLAIGAAALLAIAGGRALVAAAARGSAAAGRPVDGPTVAVLPFENLSEPGRWDRLARGVTEEVIADLATNSWIFVLADATTRPHAGETPQAVGAALGAGHVVTGTIQAEGDRVRVTAALADAATGRQLWARQLGRADRTTCSRSRRPPSEALVGELAGHWSGAIARADRARAHERRNREPRRLRALPARDRAQAPHDASRFELAEDYLRQAVEIDPHFARAWVGLSIHGLQASGTADQGEVAEFVEKRRAYTLARSKPTPTTPALIEVAKQAARTATPRLRPCPAARGRAGAERRRHPGRGGMVGPGARRLGPEARLGGAGAGAKPGGPGWYLLAKGTAAFAVGDDAAAVEALRPRPLGICRPPVLSGGGGGHARSTRMRPRGGRRLRELVPGFDLAFYMETWPREPGLWQRLHEGAVRAGLGN